MEMLENGQENNEVRPEHPREMKGKGRKIEGEIVLLLVVGVAFGERHHNVVSPSFAVSSPFSWFSSCPDQVFVLWGNSDHYGNELITFVMMFLWLQREKEEKFRSTGV